MGLTRYDTCVCMRITASCGWRLRSSACAGGTRRSRSSLSGFTSRTSCATLRPSRKSRSTEPAPPARILLATPSSPSSFVCSTHIPHQHSLRRGAVLRARALGRLKADARAGIACSLGAGPPREAMPLALPLRKGPEAPYRGPDRVPGLARGPWPRGVCGHVAHFGRGCSRSGRIAARRPRCGPPTAPSPLRRTMQSHSGGPRVALSEREGWSKEEGWSEEEDEALSD